MIKIEEMNEIEFLEMIADWFYMQAALGIHQNTDSSIEIKDRLKRISLKLQSIENFNQPRRIKNLDYEQPDWKLNGIK